MANNSKDQERLQKDRKQESSGSEKEVSSTRRDAGLGEQTEKSSNSRDLTENKSRDLSTVRERNSRSEELDRNSGL